MSNKGGPKTDQLRAMREARYEASRAAKPKAKPATPREPETRKSTSVQSNACGYKQRSGGSGTCQKAAGHMGRHQYQ